MIRQTIQKDQIDAMKAKDMIKLQTLRYILSQIKNKEIDLKRELTDQETIDVLRKEGKKLQESIDASEKANRQDLVDESKGQAQILAVYLPKELSDEDLKKMVGTIIAENKELFEKNPNGLIGICIGKLKSQADSSRISQAVRSFQ